MGVHHGLQSIPEAQAVKHFGQKSLILDKVTLVKLKIPGVSVLFFQTKHNTIKYNKLIKSKHCRNSIFL